MTDKKKIQVLVVRPGEKGVMEMHETTLEAQQKLVGGYIQMIGFGDGIAMICDEEGKLKGYEPNFAIPGDMIVGTVFFCRTDDEGECASLTEEDAKRLTAVILHGRVLGEQTLKRTVRA